MKHDKIAQLLIDSGEALEAVNEQRYTALEMAVARQGQFKAGIKRRRDTSASNSNRPPKVLKSPASPKDSL